MFPVILLCVVAVDQITKFLAFTYLQPQNTIPVINRVFYLTYLENSGAVFGILGGSTWILALLAFLIILCFSYYIYRNPRPARGMKTSIALIIAGTLGNLIDRVRIGYVIDFFDFRYLPVFNIADIAVIAGAGALILMLLFKSPGKES